MTNIFVASAISRNLRNSLLCFLLIISYTAIPQNQISKKSSAKESLPINLSKDDLFNKTKQLISNKEYKKASKLRIKKE